MAVTVTKFFSGLIESLSIYGTDAGAPGNTATLTATVETAELTSGTSRTPHATLHRKVTYELAVSLAEYAFRNIALGLAQAVVNVGSSGSYLLGTNDAADSGEIQLVVENEQEGKKHKWIMPNCKIKSGGRVVYDKENQGFIEMTFDVNADSNGHPFQVQLITA